MSGEDAHVHAPKTKDEGFGLARFDGISDRKMRQKTPERMARRSDPALCTVTSAMTRSGIERIRIPGARAGKTRKAPRMAGPSVRRGAWRGRAGRARRPCLPRAFPAVRRAMAGLTAGFGTGPGDPRLRGRARPGRPCGATLRAA